MQPGRTKPTIALRVGHPHPPGPACGQLRHPFDVLSPFRSDDGPFW
jgi:hypothetical protein